MARLQPGLARIVSRYREQLVRMGIRPERVLLFGSHAKGITRPGSDIDLVVVSPDFAPLNMRERLEALGVAAARIMEPIQAYGVTPDEVQQRTVSTFLLHVLEHEAVAV